MTDLIDIVGILENDRDWLPRPECHTQAADQSDRAAAQGGERDRQEDDIRRC
jgi:hypothetical protein